MASTAKTDLVRVIGADHVIDYTQEDFADGRRHYDVIIDIGGNRPLRDVRRALARHGRLVIVGGENGGPWLGGIERNLRAHLLSPFVTQKLGAFVSRPGGEQSIALADLVESGAVTPILDRVYSLGDAAAAIRHLAEGRARGKVVVRI